MQRFPLLGALAVATALPLAAQVPDGYYAWCSFQGRAGQTGVFFSHPRNPDTPIQLLGVTPDLAWVPGGSGGASCIQYRPGDGALLVGERAPAGHSVDLHVLHLDGHRVQTSQLFSLGTGGSVGEVPQLSLLPDGRVVVAVTDLASGPLAYLQTQSYGLEGVGIVDTVAGNVIPVPISNPSVVANGVFNGLTVSPDGSTAYIANYVSSTQGDVFALPLPQGGALTPVTTVPAGISNVAIDSAGNLLICALNGPPNLWRYDFAGGSLQAITTNNGALNAIVEETVTGNFAAVSANSGSPSRSLFWMEPNGQEHLLVDPDMATISGVTINPNPESFETGTPGINSYSWNLAPNPGGLPTTGNANFGLGITATPAQSLFPTFAFVSIGRLASAVQMVGIDVWIDPAGIQASLLMPQAASSTVSLPIPNQPALVGAELFAQAVVLEGGALASSPLLGLTIL